VARIRIRRHSWKARARTAWAQLRHPLRGRVTCLDCGFIALGDTEVSQWDRDLLAAKGTAGCSRPDELRCFRQNWFHDELGLDFRFEVLQEDRRLCTGFYRYKENSSPIEHKDLLAKAHDRREKYALALFGAFLTLLVTWVVKNLF
jgi:hypothetical protein